MTVVSSFRALDDNAEVAANQIRAKESWNRVFDEILLFGRRDSKLSSFQTDFVETVDFPTIKSLALAASFSDSMACIINSDIVVSARLRETIMEMEHKGGQCAISLRYEFNSQNPDYERAKIVDNGLDFFCAYPDVWRIVFREVPKEFRIGHCAWDSWLIGCFNTIRPRNCYDISKRRCIFHPKHGSRKRAHEIPRIQDKYTSKCGLPFLKL